MRQPWSSRPCIAMRSGPHLEAARCPTLAWGLVSARLKSASVRRRNDHDGARRCCAQRVRGAAEQRRANRPAAARSDHQELGAAIGGEASQGAGDVCVDHHLDIRIAHTALVEEALDASPSLIPDLGDLVVSGRHGIRIRQSRRGRGHDGTAVGDGVVARDRIWGLDVRGDERAAETLRKVRSDGHRPANVVIVRVERANDGGHRRPVPVAFATRRRLSAFGRVEALHAVV